MARLQKIRVHEIREREDRNGARAYRSHTFKHGGRESPRANPDQLVDSHGFWYIDDITKEVQGRVQRLLELAKQILTQQQYNVFMLTMVREDPLTEREAGKLLKLSRGRVHQLLDAAREKMQRAYDERTA